MCRLNRTPALHQALTDVFDGRVIWHPGNSGPMAGYYWASDGHMTQVELDALGELEHAHLIAIGAPPHFRRDGNPVEPTGEGASRLAEWNVRFPLGAAA